MKTKILTGLSYSLCFIGVILTIWISITNLEEIVNRSNGQYTFFSQRATLTDDEAVAYFSGWTLIFIFICFLSVRNLIRKRFIDSIICTVFLLLMIVLSMYVDKLFYHEIV